MYKYPQKFDVIIVGAGHAGVEAAFTCSKLSLKTLLITKNIDITAEIDLSPKFGGANKGQIIREIDALGGELAKNIDASAIHYRVINLQDPPSHTVEAVCDKRKYQSIVKHKIEKQRNLEFKQAEAVEIMAKGNKVSGVLTATGTYYESDVVIIATGKNLSKKIKQANKLLHFETSEVLNSLKKFGFEFKSTSVVVAPVINLDFSEIETLRAEESNTPLFYFSHSTEENPGSQIPIYLTHMANRNIEFLPYGEQTKEFYCAGLENSLSEKEQDELIQSVGLTKSKIVKYAVEIEFEFVPVIYLKPSFETKLVSGLYIIGAVNGSLGYEVSSAQGLISGINAFLSLNGKELFLPPSNSYIGLMTQYLTTNVYSVFHAEDISQDKESVRFDNADIRLMPYAYGLKMIDELRYQKFQRYSEMLLREIENLEKTYLPNQNESLANLIKKGMPYMEARLKLDKMIKKTNQKYDDIYYVELSPWNWKRFEYEIEATLRFG